MRKALPDRERALAAFPELRTIEPQLAIYEDLLRRWQARINLVGLSTLPNIWWRHFADSIQLVPALEGCESWIDLGSGAGFPGLVVALAARAGGLPPIFQLIESDSRKAAFLREVSRETRAGVEIVAIRAESLIARSIPPTIVSSRAMADIPALLALVRPWLTAGTHGRFLIGEAQHRSLAVAPVENVALSMTPSRIGPGFVLHASMYRERH